MKSLPLIVILSVLLQPLFAGESALTKTFQPFDGLGAGAGVPIITEVTCHDWYTHSGMPTAIGLISAPNIPPTNNPAEATDDLNLASICGVKFFTSDMGNPKAPLSVTMDCMKFVKPPKRYLQDRAIIIRASLECLRRTLPDKLIKTPVTLKAGDADMKWMSAIIREFNEHDSSKEFYSAPK